MKFPCPHGEVRVVVTRKSVSYRHWDGSRCVVFDSLERSPMGIPDLNELERFTRGIMRDRTDLVSGISLKAMSVRRMGQEPVIEMGEGE